MKAEWVVGIVAFVASVLPVGTLDEIIWLHPVRWSSTWSPQPRERTAAPPSDQNPANPSWTRLTSWLLTIPRSEYGVQQGAVLGKIGHQLLKPGTFPTSNDNEKPPKYAEIHKDPALNLAELIDDGIWVEQFRQDVWAHEAAG